MGEDVFEKETKEILAIKKEILSLMRPERRAAVGKLLTEDFNNTILAALRTYKNSLLLKKFDLENGSIN